jgi:hypothetical protein
MNRFTLAISLEFNNLAIPVMTKVNVQAEAEIASRYGIRGIPVIKFFC